MEVKAPKETIEPTYNLGPQQLRLRMETPPAPRPPVLHLKDTKSGASATLADREFHSITVLGNKALKEGLCAGEQSKKTLGSTYLGT